MCLSVYVPITVRVIPYVHHSRTSAHVMMRACASVCRIRVLCPMCQCTLMVMYMCVSIRPCVYGMEQYVHKIAIYIQSAQIQLLDYSSVIYTLNLGRKRTTEDDKHPGSDHPQ